MMCDKMFNNFFVGAEFGPKVHSTPVSGVFHLRGFVI